MPGSPKSRARRERTAAIIEAPTTLDDLCSFIGGGRTLIDFCKREDVLFNDVRAWIAAEKERQARYDAAVTMRDGANKDVVVGQLRRITTSDLADLVDPETNCFLRVHAMPEHARRAVAAIKVREEFADKELSAVIADRFCADLIKALYLDDDQIGELRTWADIRLRKVKLGEVIEVKLWDVNKASETLARSLKLLTDKVEHEGKVTLEQLVAGTSEPPA
jgi:hypothetical protein